MVELSTKFPRYIPTQHISSSSMYVELYMYLYEEVWYVKCPCLSTDEGPSNSMQCLPLTWRVL